MKFSLAIAASLTLYASSAFGQGPSDPPYIEFFGDLGSKCADADGIRPIDAWSIDCGNSCHTVQNGGNASAFVITSGSSAASCRVYKSDDCSGAGTMFTSGVNPTCSNAQNVYYNSVNCLCP